jgi:hypothetical protein
MVIRSFADAKWNPSVIARLHAFGCEGLEILSPAVGRPIANAAAFAEVTARIERVFSSAEYWMLSGHEVPQPKTRIVSYRKFWKSLNMNLSASSDDLTEWCVSGAEGPRYFGVAKLSLLKDVDMFRLLDSFKTSWVMVLDGMHSASDLVRDIQVGWENSYVQCPEILLKFAHKHDAVLIRNFEINDALENGVLAIARATTNQRLLKGGN